MATLDASDFLPETAEDWYAGDDDDAEVEEAAVRIQAAMRGKAARKENGAAAEGTQRMVPSQEISLKLLKPRASALAPTADGLGFAHTKLDATNMRLAGSLTKLRALNQLRIVDLSDNRLLSLEGLEHLPRLSVLLCRRNRLTGVLDFPAPPGLVRGATSCLRHADLRGNAISGAVSLPALSDGRPVGVEAHAALEVLLLDDNQLRSLRGLESAARLTQLSACRNQLIDTAGIHTLTNLVTLDLSENLLESCDELGVLVSLRDLHLQTNRLAAVPDLSRLPDLNLVELAHNQLPSAEALAAAIGNGASKLMGVSPIRTLTLDGNPLATGVADLRLRLLHLFPQVTMLDGVAADCDERVCAHNMHGDDADDLIAIRREYFGISLIDAEAQQRPRLMQLYRAQYTTAFKERLPLPEGA